MPSEKSELQRILNLISSNDPAERCEGLDSLPPLLPAENFAKAVGEIIERDPPNPQYHDHRFPDPIATRLAAIGPAVTAGLLPYLKEGANPPHIYRSISVLRQFADTHWQELPSAQLNELVRAVIRCGLSHEVERIRQEAASLLAHPKVGAAEAAAEAAPLLLCRLADEDGGIEAGNALVSIGRAAVPALEQVIKEPQRISNEANARTVFESICHVIMRLRNNAAALAGAIVSEMKRCPDNRRLLAQALAAIGCDDAAVAGEVAKMVSDTDGTTREGLVRYLLNQGQSGTPHLHELLSGEHLITMLDTILLIAGCQPSAIRPALSRLVELLEDDRREVYCKAAWALGAIRGLADEHPEVLRKLEDLCNRAIATNDDLGFSLVCGVKYAVEQRLAMQFARNIFQVDFNVPGRNAFNA